jgi:hypothetical protein
MTLEQVPSLGLTPALSRTSSSGAIVAGEEQDTFPSAMGAQLAVDEVSEEQEEEEEEVTLTKQGCMKAWLTCKHHAHC